MIRKPLSDAAAAATVAFLVFWAAIVIGWVLNLAAIVSAMIHDVPIGAMFVGRIIGVGVFPLGAILGWVWVLG